MKWEYFSGRRRISLEQFVGGAKTLEEALAIFKTRRISPPEDESLSLLFKKFKKLPADQLVDAILSRPPPIIEKKETKKSTSKRPQVTAKKPRVVRNAKRKENSA